MKPVPAPIQLLALDAARKLRERAANLRPDEELAASIAVNAALAEEFAQAYAGLRDLGLEDKVLDRFALENATPTEIRDAADVLEQLARTEKVPGREKRGEQRVSKAVVREYRVAALMFAMLSGVPLLLLGGWLFFLGAQFAKEWWLSWEYPAPARVEAPAPPPASSPVPSTPLAPINQGFERTASNQIVPVKPRDFVTDRAGILGEKVARSLNARLVQYERETSNQLLVFVDKALPADTTMEELTSASLQHWGVGQKGKDNGAIFFVFVDDRKMRIEVGYGLESVLTDARSKRIISQIVTPLFQSDRMAEGIEAGADAILAVTRGGDAALDFATRPQHVTAVSPIVPTLGLFALSGVCLALAFFFFRSLVLFLQGRPTGVFRNVGKGGKYGADGSWSSGGSSSGGSSSGGSFSSGGGSGGGGGASGSW